MERLRPTGITQAERDAKEAEQAAITRKSRIVSKLRERGYYERDDLYALAFAIRDLYQQSGLTPPQQLIDWWQAFRAAEDEVDAEGTA